MDPTLLSAEELQYECIIRGINSDINLDQTKKQLFQFLEKESSKLSEPPKTSHQVNQTNELAVCGQILEFLENQYKSGVVDKSFHSRTIHLVGRFRRISAKEVDKNTYENFRRRIQTFLDTLKAFDFPVSPIIRRPPNFDDEQFLSSQASGPNLLEQAIIDGRSYSARVNDGQSGIQKSVNILAPARLNASDSAVVQNTFVNTGTKPKQSLSNLSGQYREINRNRTNDFAYQQRKDHYSVDTDEDTLSVNDRVSPSLNNQRNRSETAKPDFTLNCGTQIVTNSSGSTNNEFYMNQIGQLNLVVAQLREEIASLRTNQSNPNINPNFRVRQYANVAQPRRKPGNPVEHWGVRFSGIKGTVSLDDFLTTVAMYTRSEKVSNEELLDWGIYLLDGPARKIYSQCFSEFRSWSDVVAKLKDVFIIGDYQRDLKKKIERTFQERNEQCALYLARMEDLFSLVSPPLSVEEKIKVLKRNLRPDISTYLVLRDIQTMVQLKTSCKQIEEHFYEINNRFRHSEQYNNRQNAFSYNRANVNEVQTEQPIYNSGESNTENTEATFVQNLAYPSEECGGLGDGNFMQDSFCQLPNEVDAIRTEPVNATGNYQRQGVVCIRCKKEGHYHRECPCQWPTGPYCYGCGALNTVRPKCTTCNVTPGNRKTGSSDTRRN